MIKHMELFSDFELQSDTFNGSNESYKWYITEFHLFSNYNKIIEIEFMCRNPYDVKRKIWAICKKHNSEIVKNKGEFSSSLINSRFYWLKNYDNQNYAHRWF